MLTLSDLSPGESGRILGFCGSGDKGYRRKLLVMGLTPNTSFKVIRRAPLGDPVQILVRGFYLSVRQHEVIQLEIERVSQ